MMKQPVVLLFCLMTVVSSVQGDGFEWTGFKCNTNNQHLLNKNVTNINTCDNLCQSLYSNFGNIGNCEIKNGYGECKCLFLFFSPFESSTPSIETTEKTTPPTTPTTPPTRQTTPRTTVRTTPPTTVRTTPRTTVRTTPPPTTVRTTTRPLVRCEDFCGRLSGYSATADECPEFDLGMQWSSAGSIHGKFCTQIIETADPFTWNDNYLCFNQDYNIGWSSAGAIAGMTCRRIIEIADPHTWQDNYLCVPSSSRFQFQWSSSNPIPGLCCIQMSEPADPHTWNDNYLCVSK